MQHEGGEQQGRDGVKVAHQRDGLRGQAHHGAKIQRVGDGRMRQRDEQHQPCGQRCDPQPGEAARQQQIRHEHQPGRAELDDGLVIGVDRAEIFAVDSGDERVEDGRAQRERDARHRAVIQPAAVQHAGDQHHAERREQHAHDLPPGQLFPEQQRRKRDEQHRGHIVAERGDGDGRIAVGLKQQHPVEADHAAGDEQGGQIPPQGGKVRLSAAQTLQKQQKNTAEQPAEAGNDRARQVDEPAQQADGPKNEHAPGKCEPGMPGGGRSHTFTSR